jgi:hypothetical protein
MEANLAAGTVWMAKLAWNPPLRVFAAGSRQDSPPMKLDSKSEPLFPKPPAVRRSGNFTTGDFEMPSRFGSPATFANL